jgi:F-type H+-transporting ATPase subunit gamma
MGGVARVSASPQRLPLLTRREPQTTAILAVTGDRGLAGGFNAQVLRRALALGRELEAEGQTVRWLVSGRKGRSTLSFRHYDIASEWTGFSDRPAYSDAQAIAHRLADLYIQGEVDRVLVVYNHFESALVQKVTEQEVLPIPEHLLATDEEERAQDAERGDFIYEPEPEEILERLLPVYLETELFRALLESAASEQGARMTAMRNASKNAGELIESLTLAMNRARQAEITQEILEVVAGADALGEA